VAFGFAAARFFGAGFSSAAAGSVASGSGAGVGAGAGGGTRAVSGPGTSLTVMWQVGFLIRATRPRARARQRFITGPSST